MRLLHAGSDHVERGAAQEQSEADRDEARHALSGNLCRCGAYDHYLNAVMRAAREA
jgi:aerobic-type carbon monoxide dehydrogenase small subunit (CoxS/CutS family)